MEASGNGWLTLAEFGNRVGLSKATIFTRLKRGAFSKLKKEKRGATGQLTTFIHESELTNAKNNYSARQAAVMATPTMIGDADFKDIELKKVKDIRVEKGKFSYRALSTALALAYEKESWETITLKTGIPRKAALILMGECNAVEKADPGKYKTVMDYLWAGRPYAAKNQKMPRKAK